MTGRDDYQQRRFCVFDEFEEISADKDNCASLLVLCHWPDGREIYLVNPKPGDQALW
jgi:hypothetical protein